jgi:hypothetical protein
VAARPPTTTGKKLVIPTLTPTQLNRQPLAVILIMPQPAKIVETPTNNQRLFKSYNFATALVMILKQRCQKAKRWRQKS